MSAPAFSTLVLWLVGSAWALPSGAWALPQSAAVEEPVLIGLVVPGAGPLADVGRAVRAGAQRAIDQANGEGGYRGRPFALRVVEEEGLWGQGLSRVVDLSFDRRVQAIVGGLDGRSAHLIQQVITRARIPFVTPWASDFTLSRGMIPWFFQAVPDDEQQARTMVQHARTAGSTQVLVVSDTSYDGRQLGQAVRQAAGTAGLPVAAVPLEGVLGDMDGGAALARLTRADAAVFLAVGYASATRVLDHLRRLPSPPRLYAPTRVAVPAFLDGAGRYPAPVLVPLPAATDPAILGPGRSGLPADLAHDAVRAIIDAIRMAGLDPWRVRDALAGQAFTGETGPVSFQNSGRRAGGVRLVPAGHSTRSVYAPVSPAPNEVTSTR